MSSSAPSLARCALAAVAVVALPLLGAGAPRDAAAAAAAELTPFQAAYVWHWKGALIALSRLNFAHQHDDIWVYSSATVPRGLGYLYPLRPKLESTMRISGNLVEPLRFRATGSGSRHDANVTFDWDAGKATGTYEGSPLDLPVTPGVQDDMSVQIAMMLQMVHGATPEILREIDKNGVRDYLYKRVGQETLSTPIGSIDTIVYATQHPGSPRITRYWCAPSQGYIPMKVEQRLNGDLQWTMTLDSLKRG